MRVLFLGSDGFLGKNLSPELKLLSASAWRHWSLQGGADLDEVTAFSKL